MSLHLSVTIVISHAINSNCLSVMFPSPHYSRFFLLTGCDAQQHCRSRGSKAHFTALPPCEARSGDAPLPAYCLSISIHAPLAGARRWPHHRAGRFLSHFNPRPLAGVRHGGSAQKTRAGNFNPRPPLRGYDLLIHKPAVIQYEFQSTPPLAGVRRNACNI